jgi:signal peptidase I
MSLRNEKGSGRTVQFMIRSAVVCAALLVFAVFVPLLFGWKPAIVTSGSMGPNLQVGDVVLIDTNDKVFGINDVVTFDRAGRSVTHRVVGQKADGRWRTKGDANPAADSELVQPGDVVGQVRFMVPMVGLPALHPEIIAVFMSGILLYAFRGSLRNVRRRERLSVAWNATSEKFAMAGVLSAVATVCIGTTLTSSVFTASTTASASFSSRHGYYSTAKSLNPRAYWRLGESAGTTSVDEQGGLNGAFTANATLGVAGALSHDDNTSITCTAGSTCWSTAYNAAYNNAGSQSIALWIKPAAATQAQYARVFTKYDGANLTYFMAYDNSGPGSAGVRMRYMLDTANERVEARSTTQITNTNLWYFVVGTFDGSTARVYVNGVQEGTDTATSAVVKQNTVGFGALTNIGSAGAKATLDDVAIWTRALSAAEVADLYAKAAS